MSRHLVLGRAPSFFELENDINLYLDPDDYVHCMMFYNLYSREILDVFRHFLRPGDTAIDVGAHVGYFTLFLATLVTHTGRVYGFEPDPRAMSSLKQSIVANGMDWVHVSPVALAEGRGSTPFYLAKGLGSSSAVRSIQQVGAQETIVDTVSLDELVEQGKVSGRIRLVKIDIEGFELDAIRGMRSLLKNMRPVILVEVNEEMLQARGESSSNLFQLLESLDYKIDALVKPRRGRYDGCFVTRPVHDVPKESGYYDVVCVPK